MTFEVINYLTLTYVNSETYELEDKTKVCQKVWFKKKSLTERL